MAERFSPVLGPGQRPDLALECFRRRIEVDLPVVISGFGNQRRDLTHVANVVRAVELALWQGPGSVILNVGTGRNHSVLDMLAAASRAGFRPEKSVKREGTFLMIWMGVAGLKDFVAIVNRFPVHPQISRYFSVR